MDFKWLNKSEMTKSNGKIEIIAPANSDFFINGPEISEEGITPASLCNAPFYYTELEGDFVLRVKVSLDFVSTYDSAAVMVMANMESWAKACFELTDFGTHAVVSVVTNGLSDDANGCNIQGKAVWLQICRCKDACAFHYSEDGKNYYMMRYFHIPCDDKIKAGILAQSPLGTSGIRTFENLSIEQKTVKNIRMGK